jgi:hypothetical protein
MWVKLHDSWLDWEWHTDPNMVSLFFHLLSMASKKDTRFRGCDIKRGQVVVGRKMLSEKTGISEQTVRTCLARLERTGEIMRKSTNKFTIITICNYNIYQPNFGDNNQQLTSNQPTANQQLTTLIDNKNIDNNTPSPRARLENETIYNSGWLDKMSMALHSTEVMQVATDIMDEWELQALPGDQWNQEKLFRYIRIRQARDFHQLCARQYRIQYLVRFLRNQDENRFAFRLFQRFQQLWSRRMVQPVHTP